MRALLVDVGGTLVNDATWLPADPYRELRLCRLAAALGERPWFQELVEHTFEEGSATTYEQRTAARAMGPERTVAPPDADWHQGS